MDQIDEIRAVLNEQEEEDQLTENEPENANDEEGGEAAEVPKIVDEITLEKLSDGMGAILDTANKFNHKLHRDITYYIDAEIDSLKDSDFQHFIELSSRFDAEEYYISNCAIGASTSYRIKFGKILRKLKKLHDKFEKGNWEDFADKHFGISKETRTLYMRISRIKGVENYAFLGVERLREVASVLKDLKIGGDDQIEALFKRFSVTLDIDLPVKDFKKNLDELLQKAKMEPDKAPPASAKEAEANLQSKEDEGSPDTPPPSSKKNAPAAGTDKKKEVLNQESLNRGINKLIETVENMLDLDVGKDVLSNEIIIDFQNKLTELNEKLEMLKEQIENF